LANTKHSLGGDGKSAAEAIASQQKTVSDDSEAVRPAGRASGQNRAVKRDTEIRPAVSDEDRKASEKSAKEADERSAKVRATVNKHPDLDDSLAHYIVTHATTLKDDEIAKMIRDHESGLVVSHGNSQWGEPAPKP
jgi:bisphosphoglycerate-dependent phosphoglycerate mutase